MSTASPLVELEDDELPLPFECPLVLATPLVPFECPLVPLLLSAMRMELFMWFLVGVI